MITRAEAAEQILVKMERMMVLDQEVVERQAEMSMISADIGDIIKRLTDSKSGG